MKPFPLALAFALAFPAQALAQAGQAAVGAGGAWTCDPKVAAAAGTVCPGSPGPLGGPRIVAGTGKATAHGGPSQPATDCPSPLSARDQAAIAEQDSLKQYFLSWWPPGCPGGP